MFEQQQQQQQNEQNVFVKLLNFRLVEITNPSVYVCANCIVSYAKFIDRPARSTDSCAIHGFLHDPWIPAKSMDP